MNRRTVTDTIVLHHSASSAATTREQIRRWHTDPPPAGRGWSDIAYHYLVFSDGHVEAGRPEDLQGAHCSAVNARSIGVCLVGLFDAAHAVPRAQWESALSLVTSLRREYSIDISRIFGHNELAATICPGFDSTYFRKDLMARGVQ